MGKEIVPNQRKELYLDWKRYIGGTRENKCTNMKNIHFCHVIIA
jgi:hypothetical protein